MLKFLSQRNVKANLNRGKYYFCTNLEKFDPEKIQIQSIIPIRIPEPLMPYGNSLRNFIKENLALNEVVKKLKDNPESMEKVAAFLYDKKRNKLVNIGVQCNLIHMENTGEVSLISKLGDKRVQLIYPDKCKFEGETVEAKEIKDTSESNKLIDLEFAKNLINDINKVIFSCLEISSKPMHFMENSLLRDLNSAAVYLQSLMQSNLEFSSNATLSQYTLNQNEGLNKFNSIVFKNIQEFLKISKTIRKYTPLLETEAFLKCEDPVQRTKLLIDFIYTVGDYVIKELHMLEEYKKDTLQKQEKFYWRFVKKHLDKLAGGESYDDYKKKLDLLIKSGEVKESARRAIELEMDLASGNTPSDGFDLDDRKKFGIVEEIFNFPWDKRDKIEFDIHHAHEVFEKNLYGMEKVKDRVYEYISKLKRVKDSTTGGVNKKGFVILVTGPPGTGKTTVAQLIGEALKRKTGIINLSGESDNITLKGSRRTYVDAQPSLFYKELVKLGVRNPVIVLDEIDKIPGRASHGSQTASATLLEILNPEENHNFIDQYLNVPLDFSETIFICTANYKVNILEPLLDRIEVIEIDDYTFKDKKDITEKFLVPKALQEYGFSSVNNPEQTLEFGQNSLQKIIKDYSTVHSGIRGIKRNIEKVIRKSNLFLTKNSDIKNLVIDDFYLNKFLGEGKIDPNFLKMVHEYTEPGSILSADLSGYLTKIIIRKKLLSPSKIKENENLKTISSNKIFNKINTIATLEKHVEESLHTAITLARYKLVDLFNDNIVNYNIMELLNSYNLYMTMPYQKKQGNSYGLAFYISFISVALHLQLPNPNIMVIGELTPFGNILRVAGLKRFLSICEFYNIKSIMLPEGNRDEFKKYLEYNKNTFDNVYFIRTTDEALDIIFPQLKKSDDLNLIIENNVRLNLL